MGSATTTARRSAPHGVRRMVELWRLFRAESKDPGAFYRRLASDVVADLEQRHGPLHDQHLADLGCGPGFYSRAFAAAGATVLPLERDHDELGGDPVGGTILGDATRLPVRTGGLDGVFCSNMLEHTPEPERVIDEMVRVLRPGGWVYLSFTNWWSPWGGHEMSPYHLLGRRLGPRVYERRHGADHKHHVGVNLFPLHIGTVLRLVRAHTDVNVERVEPRYWPFARLVTRVPGMREVLTWNCVIRLHKLDHTT